MGRLLLEPKYQTPKSRTRKEDKARVSKSRKTTKEEEMEEKYKKNGKPSKRDVERAKIAALDFPITFISFLQLALLYLESGFFCP